MLSETPTDNVQTDKDNVVESNPISSPAVSGTPSRSKKKRMIIEDDFFSLSSFSDKKSKKKQKAKKQKSTDGESTLPRSEELVTDKTENIVNSTQDVVEPKEQIDKPSISTPQTSGPEVESSKLTDTLVVKDSTPRLENLKLQESPQNPNNNVNPDLKISEEDELDMSFINSLVDDQDEDAYKFSEENEKKRMYIIKVFTKLATPKNYDTTASSDFGAKGTKLFGKILEAIIENFRSQFSRRLKAPELKQYDSSLSSLIWVEGKMEIKSFFKPSTLRIEPPQPFDILADEVESMAPTFLTCILIPKENVTNYLQIYPEFKANRTYIPITDIPLETKENDLEDLLSEEDNDVVVIDEDSPAPEPSKETVSKDAFFVIGLKGKDNKRIEVEVSPQTPLRKLLIHFLKVKELDPSSVDFNKVKLIFDDEVLDLDDTVENTELEEDFEVQVVL
ncbi:uncharacterized protein CANTADRAFT_25290 [Suhomyces tanzawaensis NRRL Y-17324]|uniref:Ubiquitin-like domain-containing protein n=1 Tax=Suhomyces tanzawaensis NRRL Y-17324 TaxID=984487 RepID=A0A1E4SNA7_9ASCO|nr:uncharacterized protein CANTADRAFT_25290 [Suhomyces tanzawaensis NRRL Y-17324]ODV80993.1 hypothetical protein CANTADRAFT_25290 [Suhomyces tanzawaensis NRRL Y-17324]